MSSTSNWKKFGGINKLDKMNFLNVNSISTDKLILREAYVGAFDICGNIAISENLSVNGITDLSYIHIRNNVDVSKNVVIQGNVLVKGNTIFTSTQSTFTEKLYFGSSNKQYFYGDPSGIGLNIETPNATLDICGNRIEVLNVFSGLSTNRNIIARNMNHKGIVAHVDNSNSTLDFFNDVSINRVNTYDGRIQYIKGGIMMIDVSDNTYVASRLSVSNRDASAHVMGETAVLYDICKNTFAYNVYDVSSVNTGNALSLISSDNSSNTFLNIVTPNKNGLSIGGGAYPLDRTKAMGTIGLYDVSNGYTPTQNIVKGSSLVKYKTTLGVNTHAPRIDNYVVDINGPIHLTNGEITNVSANDFEIKNIVFSRTNKDCGLAIGTPYSVPDPSRNIPDASLSMQQILYTQNGGKSWTKSRIVDNFTQNGRQSLLETQPINFYDGYLYDQSYSIIGGDKNFIFYSNDGGKKWNNITVAEPTEGLGYAELSVIGIYIGESDNPNSDYKRVVLLYNNSAKFRVFDIQLSLLNSNFSSNTAYDILNTNITNFNGGSGVSFNNMHGYGNYVYMVGSKIMKYDIINKVFINTASHNLPNSSTMEYNYVYAYDNNYVIAVGTNIISYTKNGGTSWTDIYVNTSELAIDSIILQSVYILDANNAMAVGNNGIIIYTTDGALTWKTADNDVINSSGNKNRIVNLDYNLNGLVMQDMNSFIVSTLITQYSNIQYNKNPGKTNIMYCFLPNLMNRNNNYVFDMSGNMGVDGDIRINSGRILIDSSNDVYSDSSNGSLQISKGGAYIRGNLKIDGRIFANGGMTSTSQTLYAEVAKFSSGVTTGDVDASGARQVKGAVVIDNSGGLYVSGNTYIGGWMDVKGNLKVIDDIDAMKNLKVYGNFNPENVIVNGAIPATGNADGALRVPNGGAYVKGNTYIDGNLVLGNNASITGTITITGSSSLNNSVNISGITTVTNTTDSGSSSTGALIVNGGVGIVKSMNIDGIATMNNTLNSESYSNGSLVVKGGVGIAKNIYINENSNVAGNSNITGNCNITGNTNATGNIIISNYNNNALNLINGGVFINGSFPTTTVNSGALRIPNGGAYVGGNLIVNANTTSSTSTSGTLIVTGGVGISENMNVGALANIGGNTRITVNTTSGNTTTGSLVVTGGVGISENVNVGGFANIGGVTQITTNTVSGNTTSGSLIVTGGVGIGGAVNIGGLANIAGIARLTSNTTSTNTTSGSLIVTGGVGISENVNIGGLANISGITRLTSNTTSGNATTGSLVVTGGVGINENVNVGALANIAGITRLTSNTTSTNTTTGSLVVTGGVGISENVNIGGLANIAGVTRLTSNTTSINTTSGSLVVTGGVGISGAVNAFSYNATSDYRIKENVKRLDNSFSVDKLEPVVYYNTVNKRDDIGFIAHKVQEVYPYLVNGEKDSPDYQTLNYIGLIGILVHEVQELKREIAELKK